MCGGGGEGGRRRGGGGEGIEGSVSGCSRQQNATVRS